ncbi:MAG: hypothetical protein Q8N26_26785 [Myxococcales bacterium]|nr:hypothetical protein [Myxococcales bacterium]
MMSIGLGELLLCSVALLLPILGVVGIVLLARGTKQKTDFGLNLSVPSGCPKCAAPLPTVRAPKNARQLLWGGWTCTSCGVELDKWGRVRNPTS